MEAEGSISRKICFFSWLWGGCCGQTGYVDIKHPGLVTKIFTFVHTGIMTPRITVNLISSMFGLCDMKQHSIGRQNNWERISMYVSCLDYTPLSLLILTDEFRLMYVLQTPAFYVFNQNTGLII